ncbi:MAG: LPS export ABC transporter permease LptF [Bdellovibrionales bacterium]
MPVFDRYLFKHLSVALIFVAVTLSVIIFLTQSLRFLELVIEASASSNIFWVLTLLALPRFFEVIMPVSLMVAILFIYSRMISDSEVIVMRAAGASPLSLSRAAIVLAVMVTVFLMVMSFWAAPKSLRAMKEMRVAVQSQFSALLFKEGVFNRIGDGLTVYIRDKNDAGELQGILINDSRDKAKAPSSVFAKRGVLLVSEDSQQVLVYDGARQEYNRETGVLTRLNFERYTIDLPQSAPIDARWKEASERTLWELMRPNLDDPLDVERLRDFKVEWHQRVVAPFLALAYAFISCVCLLSGPFDRRGQGRRIAMAVVSVVVLQGIYLSVSNISRNSDVALFGMYALVLFPTVLCWFFLSAYGERFRRYWLYSGQKAPVS